MNLNVREFIKNTVHNLGPYLFVSSCIVLFVCAISGFMELIGSYICSFVEDAVFFEDIFKCIFLVVLSIIVIATIFYVLIHRVFGLDND